MMLKMMMIAIVAYVVCVVCAQEPSWTRLTSSSTYLPGDKFGSSMDIDKSRLIIGAPSDSDVADEAGSAFIFALNTASEWIEVAHLTAPEGYVGVEDRFGYSVGISDINAVVGAPYYDGSGSLIGSLFVYSESSIGAGDWSFVIQLFEGTDGEYVGFDVAIDGSTIIAGAPFCYQGYFETGCVYFYSESSLGAGDWENDSKEYAWDAGLYDNFGYRVDVSGNTAIIGAYLEDQMGDASGSIYIYKHDIDWSYTLKLVDTQGAPQDRFGISLAIQNLTIVVGTYVTVGSVGVEGGAIIYTESSDGANDWTQVAYLQPADLAGGDAFGVAVDIDGTNVIVGSYGDDDLGSASGSAYLFSESALGAGDWTEVYKFLDPEGEANDWAGNWVTIEGGNVVVSVANEQSGGSVVVFDIGYACFGIECDNGGTCVEGLCDCVDGFAGDICSDIDYCQSNECGNGATCVNNPDFSNYTCDCMDGYFGEMCGEYDNCFEHICENGATCVPLEEIHTYDCVCTEGFTDVYCSEVDYCLSNECNNTATCVNNPDFSNYTCDCADGFTGELCSQIDLCFDHQCENDATCVPQNNTYTCECAECYTGDLCSESDLCACLDGAYNACENGANCTHVVGDQSLTCECAEGYTGALCQYSDSSYTYPSSSYTAYSSFSSYSSEFSAELPDVVIAAHMSTPTFFSFTCCLLLCVLF